MKRELKIGDKVKLRGFLIDTYVGAHIVAKDLVVSISSDDLGEGFFYGTDKSGRRFKFHRCNIKSFIVKKKKWEPPTEEQLYDWFGRYIIGIQPVGAFENLCKLVRAKESK